ncbi:MAG: hypothetical protein PHV85_05335 [Desulfovibrionaceae bacterium]|nr:hypothetical protein [Desulfovibrionaceae bacterium]MDD4951952.1 hypothetical protein [Desulfovibrionaceae bacterium]
MSGLRSRMQHSLNPLHLYCRLRSLGLAAAKAQRMCSFYERLFYRPMFWA